MLLYYLTIALQIYCFYHVYKNNSNNYWYFIIFFVPLVGGIVYIFTHVFNKRDVANITEEITTIINPTKKIKGLEKELEFSDTFQNKINLADAHFENNDYNNAIILYEKALKGNYKDEPHTLNKLIKCYFKTNTFDQVIINAKKIDLDKGFKESIYYYGLSLEQKGAFEEAEVQLKKVDKRFSNYPERIELSNFLIRRNKKTKAKELLIEITSEINSMTKANAKKYRYIINEAEKKLNEI